MTKTNNELVELLNSLNSLPEPLPLEAFRGRLDVSLPAESLPMKRITNKLLSSCQQILQAEKGLSMLFPFSAPQVFGVDGANASSPTAK